MNSPKTTRNHNVLALGFVSFFTDLASSMVVPVLPLFLVLVLDEEVEKVGLVLGIATLVSYALRFVGGALSDRLDANKPL
ncbi:MAG: MFS transporter, partial [Pseudomonadota bacterium]